MPLRSFPSSSVTILVCIFQIVENFPKVAVNIQFSFDSLQIKFRIFMSHFIRCQFRSRTFALGIVYVPG